MAKRSTTASGGGTARGGGRASKDAEPLSAGARDIAVSEFFAKNRHLLGFDNPRKALLTTVKEAVDNALDACEEAGILPDIEVRIEEVTPPPSASKPGRYVVTVTDNGPGIIRRQVEHIFGRLLYGSKFHRLKMSRGQQGIGISAAGMYGLMTTGKPMVITTRPDARRPAHHIELAMDTSRNRPEVTVDAETEDFPATSSGTGTRVAITLEARYQKGRTSVAEYLEQTAIANPHASITFIPPRRAGEEGDDDALPRAPSPEPAPEGGVARTVELTDRTVFPRGVEELPPETQEIRPHPYGVELGTFLQMLRTTSQPSLDGFLRHDFCRVTPAVVGSVCVAAGGTDGRVSGATAPGKVDAPTGERLWKALQEAKLRAPPTDCLAPIGVRTMLAGLLKGVRGEFYAASTRSPAVYRGNPFQIEAAIAFGGELSGSARDESGEARPEPARIIRFANRVPLLYQQSACCSFKSVCEVAWRNYGLSQPRGGVPVGPLVVMIHMASVWVPFTSESKEAIADYDEIRREMVLALQECGRKLGAYVRRRKLMRREHERRDVFSRYIGEIARSCESITGTPAERVYAALRAQAERRTELADAILDEDGKIVGSRREQLASTNGRLDDDDGVIIIPGVGGAPAAEAGGDGAGEPSATHPSGTEPSGTAARASKKKGKRKVRRQAASRSGGGDDGLFGGGA